MAHQRELEKLQRRYEEKPSQWFAALAEEYRRAGDIELALEIVRRGVEERSNYVSGHIVLARCLLDQGADGEAQISLERVLELDAENVIALKVLSEIADRAGAPAVARSWLERLLEVDPMNEEGLQMLERLDAATDPTTGAEGAGEAEKEAGAGEAEKEAGAEEAGEVVEVVESVGAAEAVEVAGAEETGEAVEVVESIGAEEAVETAGPTEGAVQEPAVAEVDVAPTDTVETPPVLEGFDDPAAEEPAPSEAVEHVQEEQEPTPAAELEILEDTLEPTPADELEILEDTLEPTAETAVADPESGEDETVEPMAIEPVGSGLEHDGLKPAATTDESADESSPAESGITDAGVEHDVPLELSPDAGEGPPPEGIVGAEVDRPEPIVLAGGPGMVVGSDQAAELVGEGGSSPEGESSSEDLGAGDRSPLDTEEPPIELEEPIPVQALAAPEVAEDAPAPVPAPALPTKEPEAAPTQDPEPLVTETMAEVYVKQGLPDDALKVYRALLARRPADTELLGRIAELESQVASAAVAPEEGPRYRASETGGRSTRTFLAQVLAAGAGEEAPAESPPPPPTSAAVIPEGPTPLETAFNAPGSSETPGTPTQPAPDGPSLASVFGEEPPPPPPPTPPEEQGAGSGEQGGVSYDEFFGGSGGDQAGPQPSESSGEGDQPDSEDDGFKDWLKGLKS